jgi:alanine dehydrogenase
MPAIVGCVKEVKDNEYRVGLVPGGAQALTDSGHRVLVQAGAGAGSGMSDDEYREAGAEIVPDAAGVWARSEIVVKVKEPVASEFDHLRPGQILFTYLHLAPCRS